MILQFDKGGGDALEEKPPPPCREKTVEDFNR